MTLAWLKASLALWQRRVHAREKLTARARQDLYEARAADIHPRQQLVDRLALRERQLKEARDRVARRERQIAAKERVRRPYERVKMNVACQSSRGGVKPRLIVLHSTEGANVPNSVSDLEGLGAYFDRPSTQASSHVAVDSDGYSAQYVPDGAKAWTCAAFNSVSLNVEQVGFASQRSWPDEQLRKTSQYIAYWSKKYGIPIAHSTESGVCQHSDLGAAGGGHHDPGANYPFERVLGMARAYAKDGW
jgi:N-acetyl-anhydromuramyl-L-alanine amidase AmpD